MDGVSDVRVILIVLASLIFLALFINLLYVLYCRIMFRKRSQTGGVDPEAPGDPCQYGSPVLPPPSKELLYFFCWEFDNGPVYSVETSGKIREGVHLQVQQHAPGGQGSYGGELKLPRPIILGPVKPKQEEEKEELCDCEEVVVVPPEVEEEVVVEVQEDYSFPVMEEEEEDAMNFSTASPSPFFYTPFSSPGREEEGGLGNISTGRALQSS